MTIQTHIVFIRLYIISKSVTPGFYRNLFDAQTNIYNLSLPALRHNHATQGVIIGQMVSDHRLEKLFWWHIV